MFKLEVIEHCYAPNIYARRLFDLFNLGGPAIISTSYHGYVKNLVMAIAGKMASHFTALWDHGHTKFWSFNTLGNLLKEIGIEDIHFRRIGRIAPLAQSMFVTVRKPSASYARRPFIS